VDQFEKSANCQYNHQGCKRIIKSGAKAVVLIVVEKVASHECQGGVEKEIIPPVPAQRECEQHENKNERRKGPSKKVLVKANKIITRIDNPPFDGVGWSFLGTSYESEGVMFLLVAEYKGAASGEAVEH
jgi:hypothetical protein